MNRFVRSALVALVALAIGSAAWAQPDRPRRQLDAARELIRSGQADQARSMLQSLVDEHPQSELADDALLDLATLIWPVGELPEVSAGEWTKPQVDRARQIFEQIRDDYPESSSAPEALWRLALSHLVPSPLLYKLEEASAALTTLPVLHPGSERAAAARALSAHLHQSSGRNVDAKSVAFELLADDPSGPMAGRAWLAIARAEFAEGKRAKALTALGRARIASKADDPLTSSEALDLSTLLDRILYAGARDTVLPYAPAAVTAPMTGRLANFTADPTGRLWAAKPRDGQLALIDDARGANQLRAVEGIEAVALDPWHRIWACGSFGIQSPTALSWNLPPKIDLVSLAPVSPSTVWAVDDRERRVVKIESGVGISRTARLPDRAQPMRVVGSGDQGAWVLVDREPALIRVDAEGIPNAIISLSALAPSPSDIARDELGYVYVLDADERKVLVFAEDGGLVHTVSIPDAGPNAVQKPAALSVDRAGSLAVYDARSRRVTWFR